MPHLLDRIVDAATAEAVNLPHLLRLCMVLGDQLGGELVEWVQQELNGYAEDVPLPDYRRITAPAQLMIVNLGSHATLDVTTDVIRQGLGDKADAHIHVEFREGVASISALSTAEGGSCQRRWTRAATVAVANLMTEWDPFRAWNAIGKSQLLGILDAIQNRVLTLALRLRKEHPELGERPTEELPNVSDERVNQVVNQTIHNTINVHGDSAKIHAPVSSVGAQNRDMEPLRTALASSGLNDEEVEQVTAIVKQETSSQGVLAKLKALPATLAQRAIETGVVEAIHRHFQ